MDFELDKSQIPNHIAIIMDGNGRWAKEKGLPRSAGHAEGGNNLRRITEACGNLGVKYLTLYTFSTENWNRPSDEVQAIMDLIVEKMDVDDLIRNRVQLRTIGDINRLPAKVQACFKECEEKTAQHETDLTLVIAMSYSSRWELTQTMKNAVSAAAKGQLKPEEVDEDYISRHLQTNFMPDPDLLIRTGGELRISNYLLWQCAYSEFYFCDTYWPDFSPEDLQRAIAAYQQRQRRFGLTGEQVEK